MDDGPHAVAALECLLVVIGALALGAAVVTAEIGWQAVSTERARELRDKDVRGAGALARLQEAPGRTLLTVFLTITLLGAVAQAVAAVMARHWFAGAWLPAAGVPFAGVLLLELLPALYAARNPERAALATAPLLAAFVAALRPLTALTGRGVAAAVASSGGRLPLRLTATEEDIKEAIEAAEADGTIAKKDLAILTGIMDFGDKTAREAMVPRTDMDAIRVDASLDEVLGTIIGEGHSRIPVYRDTIDDIIGVVYAKDLIPCLRLGATQIALGGIVRPVPFVPETKKLDELFAELCQARVHIAMVVEEYGGIAGMVTIEDLLEEVVGDILDEHDAAEQQYEQVNEDHWVLDPLLTLRQVRHLTEVDLPGDEADTLSGFILTQLESLPVAGQTVALDDWHLRVDQMDGQRIEVVSLLRHRPDPDAETTADAEGVVR